MPSIKTTTPILGGRYYHIFNRGINRNPIFFTESNYTYFLILMKRYFIGYLDVLVFCLLHNHFHLVVKVKDELELRKRSHSTEKIGNDSDTYIEKEKRPGLYESENIQTGSVKLKNEEEIGKLVTRQLRRLFISYAMAINRQENRVGSLFDPKFKRLEITTQKYLEYAIFYVHYNPEKHGYTNDFKEYKFCSYKAILSKGKTNLDREFLLELFGGKDEFINYHSVMHEERDAVIME